MTATAIFRLRLILLGALLLPLLPASASSAQPPLRVKVEGALLPAIERGVWLLTYDAEAGVPARLSWAGQTLEADSLAYFTEDHAVYAEGVVRLRRAGLLLRARVLYYDLAAGRGSAEGVYIHASRQLLEGIIPGEADALKLEIAHTPIEQVILRAKKVEWSSPRTTPDGRELPGRMIATGVELTTCDFARPHWHVKSRIVEMELSRGGITALRSRGNTLLIGRVPILKLPRLSRDMKRLARISALELTARNSSEWGQTVFADVGFNFGRPLGGETPAPFALQDLTARGDFRELRGFAGGLSGAYRTGASGRGRFSYTYLVESLISNADDAARAARNKLRRDSKLTGTPLRQFEENLLFGARRFADGVGAGSASTETFQYADASRFAAELEHRSSWGERPGEFASSRLDLDLELHAYRDRDYRQEYEEDAFKRGKEPETLAALRHSAQDYSLELAGTWRANPFFTRTEYLPEARLSVPGRPIGGGFVLATDLFAGRLRRRFDELENVPDLESTRLSAYVQLSRPIRIGPLRCNNFIATQQTYYGDGRAGEAFWQGAFLYGVELSTRLYGKFPARGSDGDVQGYRHIIEPRVRFLNVSEPTHDPVEVYDFDEIDDINEVDLLTFSLDQKLQVKRLRPEGGGAEVRDVAALELSLDMFTEDGVADRLNGGNDFDALRIAALLAPVDSVRVYVKALWSLHGDGVEETVGGIVLRGRDDRWRAELAAHSTRDLLAARGIPGATDLALRIEAPLSRRWRLGLLTRFELEQTPTGSALQDRGLTDLRVVLTREFHDWMFSVRVGFDEAEDDRSVSFSLVPRGSAANLRRAAAELIEVGTPPTDAVFWNGP